MGAKISKKSRFVLKGAEFFMLQKERKEGTFFAQKKNEIMQGFRPPTMTAIFYPIMEEEMG